MKRTVVLPAFILIAFISCNKSYNNALKQIKEKPPADYSYVVHPVFKETKDIAQSKTKNLFNADEVKIGAVGFHKYDPQTKTQKEQTYRLQTVLLNSKSIVDYKNEAQMNELSLNVAKYVVDNIANIEKYNKIEISFINIENTSQNVLRQNIFYKLPDYELTQMFDK